jgi:hypothetical protein
MSEAQKEYIRSGRSKVAGWLQRLDAESFIALRLFCVASRGPVSISER